MDALDNLRSPRSSHMVSLVFRFVCLFVCLGEGVVVLLFVCCLLFFVVVLFCFVFCCLFVFSSGSYKYHLMKKSIYEIHANIKDLLQSEHLLCLIITFIVRFC